MAKPSKYVKEFHDDWGWSLAIKGATDKEIAVAMGVTERTINRWKYETEQGKPTLDSEGNKILSSFGRALISGKEAADAKVERSLFEKCIGYNYSEEEKIIEYDIDGSVKPVKVRTTKKHISPDTMAIMYWLNNRSRKTGEWSQKQDNVIDLSVTEMREQMQSIADLINHPEQDRENL